MSALPGWWDSSFPDLVAQRQAMPGVSGLQTSYTRYKRGDTSIKPSWEAAVSRRNLELLACDNGGALSKPEDFALFSGKAPKSVSLRIVEAPAEFAVPVKQDRRLMPSFRVQVEVKYRQQVSFPLTLRAHVITQQEKDNVLAWVPEDANDPDKFLRKPVTELKGTTCITHHFEANEGNGNNSSYTGSDKETSMLTDLSTIFPSQSGATSASSILELSKLQNSTLQSLNKAVSPAMLVSIWNNENDVKLLEQMLIQQQLPGNRVLFTTPQPAPLTFQVGGQNVFQQLQSQQQAHMQQSHRQMQTLDELSQAAQHTLIQDFQFSNMEFVRPTRMNKVYLVFACTILDLDAVFVVYNVPTVCICRAEQKDKACQKLGVPLTMQDSDQIACRVGRCKVEPASHQATWNGNGDWNDGNNCSARHPFGKRKQQQESSGSDGSCEPVPSSFPPNGRPPGNSNDRDARQENSMAMPHSKLALQEFIAEEYEGTGLLRKLTAMDMQALLSQAGFPADSSSNNASISQAQWDEFVVHYRTILSLLCHISAVWNLEEPFLVCGFDMDRVGTVNALSKEPAGTFICRFSMSQPGCLVLSCKTVANHPKADLDGLIHAIIKIEDLNERRADTWIRDFAGATHVLDVYRSRRVDKRKVFASNYLRLKCMEQNVNPADS